MTPVAVDDSHALLTMGVMNGHEVRDPTMAFIQEGDIL